MDRITELLDEFRKTGICEVDFGEGGEATLHPNLARIICYTAEKCKMIPNLTTNLTVPLSDELIETLSRYAGIVVISLDNYHHPDFAQYGIPVEIKENLKKLRLKGIKPAVNYVYEPNNITRIIHDIRWLNREGFTKITLLRRLGNYYTHKRTLPSNNEIDDLLNFLNHLDIEVGFASCDPILDHPLIFNAVAKTGLPTGAKCKAGKEFVFVDINGNVRPCGFCPPSKALKSSFQDSIIMLQNTFSADCIKNIIDCPYKNINERR
jgi:MoaA/NifB/PqqE/SkfB family radical SAM enzyme